MKNSDSTWIATEQHTWSWVYSLYTMWMHHGASCGRPLRNSYKTIRSPTQNRVILSSLWCVCLVMDRLFAVQEETWINDDIRALVIPASC